MVKYKFGNASALAYTLIKQPRWSHHCFISWDSQMKEILTFGLWEYFYFSLDCFCFHTSWFSYRQIKNRCIINRPICCINIYSISFFFQIILLPCGHVSICEDCSDYIKDKCPVCRAVIISKAPAFITWSELHLNYLLKIAIFSIDVQSMT